MRVYKSAPCATGSFSNVFENRLQDYTPLPQTADVCPVAGPCRAPGVVTRDRRSLAMEVHTSQSTPEQKYETPLLWSLVVLGIIGLIDAIIITVHHFIPGPPPEYAFMFGIPTAPAGIFWYCVILSVIFLFIRTRNQGLFSVLLALLTFEFLYGIVVFYLQTFVLRFFCEYAYLYVVVSLLMFVIGIVLCRMQGTR